MILRTLFFLLLVLLTLNLYAHGQAASNIKSKQSVAEDDYLKIVAVNNSILLLREIGEKSVNLSNINQRIDLRLQTAKVLWNYDAEKAEKFLELAWQDTFLKEAAGKNHTSYQQKQILNFAAKVAPTKADKWLKEIKQDVPDKTEQLNKEPRSLTLRQQADAILESSIAKAGDNPEQAVSAALASLNQTGKISSGFNQLIEKLRASKRTDLIKIIYETLNSFTSVRTSLDSQELLTVINLMFDKSADTNSQNKLFAFLINSGRQILINQNSDGLLPKVSATEILTIYKNFALLLKPFLQNTPELFQNIAQLDAVLRDMADLIEPDKLQDPLLNPELIETQIEKAKKTTGATERDIKLSKILSFLLSRRQRKEKNSLKLAQEAADEITDLEAKQKFNDFIQIIKIEQQIEYKNLSEAEKIARKISSEDIKGWALMALGKLQDDIPPAARDLYDETFMFLKKSESSAFKTQSAFILASLYAKIDKNKSLDIFTEAAKFSAQYEEKNEQKESTGKPNLQIIFFSTIGGLDFNAADFELTSDFINIPDELGALAVDKWNEIFNVSQQIQPLNVRYSFQIEMAKTVLQKFVKNQKGKAQ